MPIASRAQNLSRNIEVPITPHEADTLPALEDFSILIEGDNKSTGNEPENNLEVQHDMNTTQHRTGCTQPSVWAAQSHRFQNSSRDPRGLSAGRACSDRAGIGKCLPSWTGATNRHGLRWERRGKGGKGEKSVLRLGPEPRGPAKAWQLLILEWAMITANPRKGVQAYTGMAKHNATARGPHGLNPTMLQEHSQPD